MSLIGALNIGKSALTAHQAAIQVTSNNIANAGNANYTRESADLKPGVAVQVKPGLFLGTGVYLDSISRQVDEALNERIRNSASDEQAAGLKQQYLGRIESVFNALGDNNLSSQLNDFFNSWSSLANNPTDAGLRQVVLQKADTIVNTFKSVRTQLLGVNQDAGTQLGNLVSQANQLVGQVATLNQQIATAEAGNGQGANSLRDQRDAVLGQLSQMVDIKVQDTGNGMVNVTLGSEPLVLQDRSMGLKVGTKVVNGQVQSVLATVVGNTDLQPSAGQIGALLSMNDDSATVVGQVDALASNLVNEVNKIHASGQGTKWYSTLTANNTVADPSATLDAAGLPFSPQNGSFLVQVRNKSTGLVTTQLMNVDLDGQNGNDTTLNSLATQLSSVAGISATAASGRLKISSQSSDYEFSFAQDTSNSLAALGVNTFFTGRNAGDIGVSADLKKNPALLAAAASGEPTDNTSAKAMAQLASSALSGLGGMSLTDGYAAMVSAVGSASSSAKTSQEAAQAVSDTLSSQRESLSGVSLDEEAINLMREQRAFQAAARVVSTVDQMMQVLMQMT